MKHRKPDPRISAILKFYRGKDLGVHDVAIAIGVTDMTVYNWEKGGRVSRIASVLVDRAVASISDPRTAN